MIWLARAFAATRARADNQQGGSGFRAHCCQSCLVLVPLGVDWSLLFIWFFVSRSLSPLPFFFFWALYLIRHLSSHRNHFAVERARSSKGLFSFFYCCRVFFFCINPPTSTPTERLFRATFQGLRFFLGPRTHVCMLWGMSMPTAEPCCRFPALL